MKVGYYTQEEFIKAIEDQHFWIRDRWGHFKSPTGAFRIKIQARSWRLEKRINTKPPSWVKKSGFFYSKTDFTNMVVIVIARGGLERIKYLGS